MKRWRKGIIMNVEDIYLYLKSLSKNDVNGTDTLKCGSWDKEVNNVAVTMLATVDVIEKAIEWGADLIITHEPTFYDHMDKIFENDMVSDKKMKLIDSSGISIIRFHDYMHGCEPDMIGQGEFYYLGLEGEYVKGNQFAVNRFNCKNEITPVELAELMEEQLGIKHIRICGARDVKCTKISACFGTPGGVFEELRDDDVEIVLTGEACEWSLGEYARDAAALGYKKALLIMGHIGSERDGMKYLTKLLKEEFRDLEIKYFDCGEVYSYTN